MIITLPVGGGGGLTILVDTQAVILAASPASYLGGIATDTLLYFVSDGSAWREVGYVQIKSANPDMGYYQDSPLDGYSTTFITDKDLSNCGILGNANATEGSVKTVSGKFYVYLNAVWNEIVINFRFREDPDGTCTFEHMPIGMTQWIEIMSGNSNDLLGINGKPIIQQYNASVGAYPVDLVIDGGTF